MCSTAAHRAQTGSKINLPHPSRGKAQRHVKQRRLARLRLWTPRCNGLQTKGLIPNIVTTSACAGNKVQESSFRPFYHQN
jgi:hypothetical protein